ncbi:MAG TPA: hydroxymethylbilane synthase [Candidatus Limnocylindrales bacterium]|nr:hydroxymethylbilane synthase [Candidatus Limnocylindrales bacterium]
MTGGGPAARTLRIGTRGSELALVQARLVAAALASHGVESELVVIRTEGDDRPSDTAWGEGAFVGRIVGALLEGSVDVAVHSAKDVPTEEDPRLVIAAYPPREDPRDALVCRVRGTTLATLPSGARVGTDSPRRVAFVRAIRPDLDLHPLHGNVDTRLAKLDSGESDALVLAVAGLTRLGRADRIDEILDPVLVAPAPGQGSLAVQVRADDDEAVASVGLLDDPGTRAEVEAERRFLRGTGGGCRSPIGALGRVRRDGTLELVAMAERQLGVDGRTPPIARVRGAAAVADRAPLAARLAAAVVDRRARPRVLTLRPDAQAEPLLDALRAAGLDAANVPAIAITPADEQALVAALRDAMPGQRIVVTSPNGAEAVLRGLGRLGLDPGRFAWAAPGETTRAVLAGAGADDAFVPSTPDGASLAEELPVEAGQPILLARAEAADAALAGTLRARGAVVAEAVAYRTIEAPDASRPILAAILDDGPVDAIVVTSGSTGRGLLALAADEATAAVLRATTVVAIGRPSEAAARAAGFERVLVAPSPDPAVVAGFVAGELAATPSTSRSPTHATHEHDAATIPAGGSR